MMGAASLPNPQASMPAGFAAFLGTIGQTPTGGGEDGGFEQLLAAIPAVDAPTAKAAPVTPVAVVTPATPVTPAAIAATTVVAPTAATSDGTAIDVTVEAPVANATKAAPKADPDTVAASVAKLLIELNGSAAKPETKSLKAVETEVKADGTAAAENGSDIAKPAETIAAPAAAASPVPVAALPVAASPVAAAVVAAVVSKPVKAGDTAALPTSDAAATTEVSTPDKPRSAETQPAAPEIETASAAPAASKPRAAPLPGPAFTATEPVAAKPADTAPSMTIQFAQPMTTGAAMLASTAAPITFAERVLDLSSDGAWIDQLAHDIAATKSDSGDISFRLMPRHLGRLDVAMVMGDEGVALKLDTQHEATATIVTAAQGRLVEDLRQQGVRVSASEVTCTPGDTNRQMQDQAQGQGRGAAQDVSHLIETVTERVKARDAEEAADRRGRFA